MTDTGSPSPRPTARGSAALYFHDRRRNRRPQIPGPIQISTQRPRCLVGGHGLSPTAADYHRFTRLLLRAASSTGSGCWRRAPSS